MKKILGRGLAVLAAATLIAGCAGKGDSQKISSTTEVDISILDADSVELDEYRKLEVPRDAGERISLDAATGKLARYKNWRRRNDRNPYNVQNDVYGFSFGIDELRSLLDDVDSINQIKPDSWTGIRIYWSRSLTPKGNEINDVFLMPVNIYGDPMYPSVDFDGKDDEPSPATSASEETLILNVSVPCPKVCGEQIKKKLAN
jgi:hypothetical protein